MSDLENIRWCPACQHESLDGDERFCKRCCKVFDQLFPDGKWHDMETDDLIEHYHCGADSVHVDDDEDDSGIPPVSDLNAPKKEEGKKSFLQEWGAVLIPVAMVVIGLLILFLLRDT